MLLHEPPQRRPTIAHARPLARALWPYAPAAKRGTLAVLLRDYLDWCWTHRRAAVPAPSQELTGWIDALIGRGLSASSVRQRLQLVAALHVRLGKPDPSEPARAFFRRHLRRAR